MRARPADARRGNRWSYSRPSATAIPRIYGPAGVQAWRATDADAYPLRGTLSAAIERRIIVTRMAEDDLQCAGHRVAERRAKLFGFLLRGTAEGREERAAATSRTDPA